MENLLLLIAAILSGSCALLSFTVKAFNPRRLLFVLWSLSTVSTVAALILMVIHLVSSDFGYLYVYSHSSLDTGLIYKISALWSGQEGSFLLWAFIIGVMGSFVLKWKGSIKSFGIYSIICLCLYLMCFFTKPFEQMNIVSADGLGLNVALKDPWMILHPPLVFISYSAMAILFASSANKKDIGNVSRILIWQRVSWFFLGAGILSGSIWAYRALGWGGYWAWDPIENAALVPWLILCGYQHRKKSYGRSACMIPFSVACFGVFLARSGILKNQSAHAYAGGNLIVSIIILCFLSAVFLFLLLPKLRALKKNHKKQEGKGMIGKLIFCSLNGFAVLVLFGTVFPLIFHITMPMEFYNVSSLIFVLVYCILLLIYDLEWLKKRNVAMMVTATVLTIGINIITGSPKLGLLLVIWVCLLPVSLWLVSGFRPRGLQYYLPHIGVILLMIGAIASSVLGKEAFIIADRESTEIQVEGIVIPSEELSEKGMIIKTMPLQDVLIKCSDISNTSQGIIIPYETKPLILMFWSGSLLVILQPCICLMMDRRKKKNLSPGKIRTT